MRISDWSSDVCSSDLPVADNPQAPDAKTVGQQVCTACHSKESQVFAHTTHALGMQVAFTANPEAATCEACHGPGSAHAQNPLQPGAIIAFTRDGGTPIKTQTESCLGCHTGGPRDHWLGSIHQRNQLSCSDCHNTMAQFSVTGLQAKQSINRPEHTSELQSLMRISYAVFCLKKNTRHQPKHIIHNAD